MTEAVSVEITTNVSEYPFEKRYPNSMKVGDFKTKLELIVGAEASSIALKLLDNQGKPVVDMKDDEKTLKDYGVRNGMKIYAVDVSGGNTDLNDDSMIDKYEMADEEYDKREDSVRAWKKKMMAQKAAGTQETKADPNVEAAKNIKVGDRCEVTIKGFSTRRGQVAFLGETKFKPGVWVGIKYDEPVGKNDGSVDGVRYFDCGHKYGGFVHPVDVTVGDFPEEDIDEM